MKKIAVLGSTGSIGTQTLDIVRNNKEDLEVLALAASNSVELMEAQIREFSPKVVAMWSEKAAEELKVRVKDLDVKVLCGMEGLLEIAVMEEVDTLVTAIVGMIGIRPTIEAIKAGKDIALANKEKNIGVINFQSGIILLKFILNLRRLTGFLMNFLSKLYPSVQAVK